MTCCKANKQMIYNFHELVWHDDLNFLLVQMIGCKSNKQKVCLLCEQFWHVCSTYIFLQMICCKLNKWMAYHFHGLSWHENLKCFLSKWFVANQSSEWLISCMNCFDMLFKNFFESKWFVTNWKGKWFNFLIIFMNSFDMSFQISTLPKWLFAN